ncbi:Protein kinase-like domain protein [Moelleriella libera RCEF 2490]|uniref:Protein kinase-like domain protein n=1 Tax=Moelleriella libera RCEF 2490 TaxID=1081109 RepID=A0A162IE79_9HYPO|nr:Protein kinase-like domain protein [Moelleriella libera RCEF 2490]
MQFIAGKTNIPVPKLHACFEDGGVAYPVMECVSGETMSELSADDRKVVEMELEGFLWTLRALTSDAWNGPSGIAVIDWEYVGFYPVEFGAQYFRRPGPLVAFEGEMDDTGDLLDIMSKDLAE